MKLSILEQCGTKSNIVIPLYWNRRQKTTTHDWNQQTTSESVRIVTSILYEYNVTTTCICFQFHAVNLKDKFYIRISLEFTFAIIRYGWYSALFAWLKWTSVKIKKLLVVGYIAICEMFIPQPCIEDFPTIR